MKRLLVVDHSDPDEPVVLETFEVGVDGKLLVFSTDEELRGVEDEAGLRRHYAASSFVSVEEAPIDRA